MAKQLILNTQTLNKYKDAGLDNPKCKSALEVMTEYYLSCVVDRLQNKYGVCQEYNNFRNPDDVKTKSAKASDLRKIKVVKDGVEKSQAPKSYFSAPTNLLLVENYFLIKFIGELKMMFIENGSYSFPDKVEDIIEKARNELIKPVIPFIDFVAGLATPLGLDYSDIDTTALRNVVNQYFRPDDGSNNTKITKQIEQLITIYAGFIRVLTYYVASVGYHAKNTPSKGNIFGYLYMLDTQAAVQNKGNDLSDRIFTELSEFLDAWELRKAAKPKKEPAEKKAGASKGAAKGKGTGKRAAKKTAVVEPESESESSEKSEHLEDVGDDGDYF